MARLLVDCRSKPRGVISEAAARRESQRVCYRSKGNSRGRGVVVHYGERNGALSPAGSAWASRLGGGAAQPPVGMCDAQGSAQPFDECFGRSKTRRRARAEWSALARTLVLKGEAPVAA